MSEGPSYTPFHPRWYRRPVSTYWWIAKAAYLRFILRELTSLAVAWFVIVLLVLGRAVVRGPEAYAGFQEWLRSPALLVANGLALLFVVYHAVTWFLLAPKAMPVRLGGKRLPDVLVAVPGFAGWLAVSAVLAWLLVGG